MIGGAHHGTAGDMGEAQVVADFAEPFGVLNFYDYAAFLNALDAGEPRADVAGPDGLFDLRDIDVTGSGFDGEIPLDHACGYIA